MFVKALTILLLYLFNSSDYSSFSDHMSYHYDYFGDHLEY
jgi:hypothetical protein